MRDTTAASETYGIVRRLAPCMAILTIVCALAACAQSNVREMAGTQKTGPFVVDADLVKPSRPTAAPAPSQAPSSSRPTTVSSAPQPTVPIAAASPPAQSATAPARAPDIVAWPFREAVTYAAGEMLMAMPLDLNKRGVVIDPMLDGLTAERNNATLGVENIVKQVIRANPDKFVLQPLDVDSIERKPLLLIGTFTGVNNNDEATGTRTLYRICLALADTATGRIIARGGAHTTADGVDLTPLAYFRDAPAWSADRITDAYIRSCQDSKPGDAMDPLYRARLISGASVNHAVDAYNAGRYQAALDFYSIAMRAGAGDELRIMNGVYLANWKLKRKDAARLVVQRIVGFGIERKRLAIKFLFEPGSLRFWKDPDFLAAYPLWMDELASQAAEHNACMQVLGHSSRGRPDDSGIGLSQERADFVRQLLVQQRKALANNTTAIGRGAQDNLVGNGRNDMTDVLDRRVVFRVVDCKPSAAT